MQEPHSRSTKGAADSVQPDAESASEVDESTGRPIGLNPTVGFSVPADAPRTLPICFGDYELIGEIASGGMGVVYKALQVSLNRVVAVKMIKAGELANAADIRRFHAEAAAAAQLDHPNIVPVYEVGDHDGQPYFSMGYVEGGRLSDRTSNGPLDPREAAAFTLTIAQGVAYAHDRGVIHRDIKPSNVLLDGQGQPRITDFGLAKRVEGDSELTASGQVLGTPSYMPPEQAKGALHDIGPRSDVYSIGALLYSLLAGRPPFQSATIVDTLQQVISATPVPPRQLNTAIPRDLETICLKCLEKDVNNRYESAAALVKDLESYLQDEPIQAKPVGLIQTTWRWYTGRRESAVWTAGGFAIILGIILLLWNLTGIPAVLFLDRYQAVRAAALIELLLAMAMVSIPSILLGYLTLRRHAWALTAGLLFSFGSFIFTLLVFLGVLSLKSTHSESVDALGALMLLLSSIMTVLYAIAVYSVPRRSRRTQ